MHSGDYICDHHITKEDDAPSMAMFEEMRDDPDSYEIPLIIL